MSVQSVDIIEDALADWIDTHVIAQSIIEAFQDANISEGAVGKLADFQQLWLAALQQLPSLLSNEAINMLS